MKKLSDLFRKIALKRLSKVETDPEVSHQHELNGVRALVELLGIPRGKQKYPANIIYIADGREGESIHGVEISGSDEPGHVTWYDARERNPDRTEYRLYYSSPLFQEVAQEGDLLLIGFDGRQVWMIAAEQGSTAESQLLWMFTGNSALPLFDTRYRLEDVPERSGPVAGIETTILEEFGIPVEPDIPEVDIDRMIEHFMGKFPTTREFSAYARKDTGIASSLDDPDTILLEWWNREEILFRALEKHIVEARIREGFEDVDQFVSFALSVINRRKSRAGHAFENHLEQVFSDHGLLHTRGGKTEGKSRPDFIFPSSESYALASAGKFPVECLTILGAKTTCKDRWRQVTREAKLVRDKHLVTLEPAISRDQTEEMRSLLLQLVVPKEIGKTYTPEQQEWLMDLSEFLGMVTEKQVGCTSLEV